MGKAHKSTLTTEIMQTHKLVENFCWTILFKKYKKISKKMFGYPGK